MQDPAHHCGEVDIHLPLDKGKMAHLKYPFWDPILVWFQVSSDPPSDPVGDGIHHMYPSVAHVGGEGSSGEGVPDPPQRGTGNGSNMAQIPISQSGCWYTLKPLSAFSDHPYSIRGF